MKLSALLILAAAACTCVAQKTAASTPISSSDQNARIGIVDDQALSRASDALAESFAREELQKRIRFLSRGNCPVLLTSARMTPHLMLLNTSGEAIGNGIDLEFNNLSGKEIRSIGISAQLLVKKNIYDLGYLPPIHLHLTAYGIRGLDKTFAHLRHLPLPDEIHAGLLEGVTLEQVTYSDGSVWTPTNSDYCGVSPRQSLPVAR